MRTLASCLLVTACLLPQWTFACKPTAGQAIKALTEEEKYSGAQLVFVGTVIALRQAPAWKSASQHPHLVQATLAVKHWLKGSGGSLVEMMDTAGTDCDPLTGISHIAAQAHPLSSTWQVYAREAHGRFWIITADRVMDPQ